jgi:hypothetical protein
LGFGLLVMAMSGAARAQTKECVNASDQGQQLRDQGKYRQARDQFAICARDACPPLIRRDCGQWLSDLNQMWPTVVVRAKDDRENDLIDVKVTVDGAPLVAALNGEPLRVDPGQHVFRYETANFPASEEKVLIVAGEKNRLLKTQFGSPSARGTTTDDNNKSADGGNGGSAVNLLAPTTHREPPTLAWVFTGVAVVAFGTEAYFGLTGLSQRSSDMSQPCATSKTCDVSGIRTEFAIADVSLGAAVVSGLLAGYFFLFAPRSPSPPPVGLAPLPGGGEASLGARF